jgi:hypothetical protein
VELYYPAGACFNSNNGGDTYVFSGVQYNWVSLYEPAANTCANTLGANDNSAYIGAFYAPGASVAISSPVVEEAAGTGGILAASLSFSGTLPSIVYSSLYAPVAPAGRLVS